MIIKQYKIDTGLNLNLNHFTPDNSSVKLPVLFIHPTGFVSNMFSPLVAHLPKINAFGLDLRSHGSSDRGDVSDWKHLAKDLESVFAFIKKLSGVDKILGVGISSGSSALALHASSHSEDFKGLYLCEPIVFPPGANLATREFLANSARNRRDVFDSRQEVYDRFSSKGPLSSMSKSAMALYAKYGFKQDGDKVTLACKKEDEEAIYLSGSENKVFELLKNIRVKTKIVFGEKSDTVDKKLADLISEQISDSSVEELSGVGHFTLFENPILGAKSLDEFISQI